MTRSDFPAKVLSVIACPTCKSELRVVDGALHCGECSHTYAVVDGIPQLFPRADERTIDPSRLRIKSNEEAARTIIEMTRMDSGFIRSPRIFYIVYLALAISLVAGWVPVFIAVLLVLAADWVFFCTRRARILRRDLANPLRLRSAADHMEIDALYMRHGERQPAMSDWVTLARESTGPTNRAPTRDVPLPQIGDAGLQTDDERYRDVLRVHTARSQPSDVVVDVGANDGRAYSRFGIGKGATFIGIDVSRSLLEKFRENVPDQIAIQADGAALPLRDGTVDFLFCTETLEHIADPRAAMSEFVRALKPGGRLMVQSPNAHRVRNLNIFHIAILILGFATDRVLQKKTFHENTWHNAVTYHWDFSRQDYRRTLRGQPCRIKELYSRSFFFPGFLLGGRLDRLRRKERLFGSIPLVRFLGDDLVVVAERVG